MEAPPGSIRFTNIFSKRENAMQKKLDCRGQACPAPVLQVRDILAQENPAVVHVLVDNQAARENVGRFLVHQGFQVTVEEREGEFLVAGTRSGEACEVMAEPELAAMVVEKKIAVLVTTDRMGHGDDSLGRGLMLNFLKTLKEMGGELWRLMFVNGGVRLTVEGADTLPVLQALVKEESVSVLVCGTCLNHFNLLEKKQVGETTNMLDIVTSLQVADKVITI